MSAAMKTALPRLLTVDELGEVLGRSRRQLYRWHEEKGLPAMKVGRSLFFDETAVLSWLVGQNVEEERS